MKFSLVLAGLAACVAARPHWGDKERCVSQEYANQLVADFASALTHENVQASNRTLQRILGDNFYENSQSINVLAGYPVSSTAMPSPSTITNESQIEAETFRGKQGYINGLLGSQGPAGIQTNYVYVANCNNVVWKWIFRQVGNRKYPVSGINIFHLNSQGQIANMDVEFNSIAWGVDIGFTVIDYTGKQL